MRNRGQGLTLVCLLLSFGRTHLVRAGSAAGECPRRYRAVSEGIHLYEPPDDVAEVKRLLQRMNELRGRPGRESERSEIRNELFQVLQPYIETAAEAIARGGKGYVTTGAVGFYNAHLDADEVINESFARLDRLENLSDNLSLQTYITNFVGRSALAIVRRGRSIKARPDVSADIPSSANQELPLLSLFDEKNLENYRSNSLNKNSPAVRILGEIINAIPPQDSLLLRTKLLKPHLSHEELAKAVGIPISDVKESLNRAYHQVFSKIAGLDPYDPVCRDLLRAFWSSPKISSLAKAGGAFTRYPKLLTDLPKPLQDFAKQYALGSKPAEFVTEAEEKQFRSYRTQLGQMLQARGFGEPDQLTHQLYLLRYSEGPLPKPLADLKRRLTENLPKLGAKTQAIVRDYFLERLSLEQIQKRSGAKDTANINARAGGAVREVLRLLAPEQLKEAG